MPLLDHVHDVEGRTISHNDKGFKYNLLLGIKPRAARGRCVQSVPNMSTGTSEDVFRLLAIGEPTNG